MPDEQVVLRRASLLLGGTFPFSRLGNTSGNVKARPLIEQRCLGGKSRRVTDVSDSSRVSAWLPLIDTRCYEKVLSTIFDSVHISLKTTY